MFESPSLVKLNRLALFEFIVSMALRVCLFVSRITDNALNQHELKSGTKMVENQLGLIVS